MQTTIIESVLKKDDTVWRAPCRNYVAFVKEGKLYNALDDFLHSLYKMTGAAAYTYPTPLF